jgi:hypothetical protein
LFRFWVSFFAEFSQVSSFSVPWLISIRSLTSIVIGPYSSWMNDQHFWLMLNHCQSSPTTRAYLGKGRSCQEISITEKRVQTFKWLYILAESQEVLM